MRPPSWATSRRSPPTRSRAARPERPAKTKTVAYLVEAFKTLGLKPGNPDGTYVQKVPLVGITAAAAPLTITGGAGRLAGARDAGAGATTSWPGPSG